MRPYARPCACAYAYAQANRRTGAQARMPYARISTCACCGTCRAASSEPAMQVGLHLTQAGVREAARAHARTDPRTHTCSLIPARAAMAHDRANRGSVTRKYAPTRKRTRTHATMYASQQASQQASEPASQQASKQASKKESKAASQQASQQASKQGSRQQLQPASKIADIRKQARKQSCERAHEEAEKQHSIAHA